MPKISPSFSSIVSPPAYRLNYLISPYSESWGSPSPVECPLENENLSSPSEIQPHQRYIPAMRLHVVVTLANSPMNSPVGIFQHSTLHVHRYQQKFNNQKIFHMELHSL